MATGVDGDATLRANSEGYANLALRVRRLAGAHAPDTSVSLFGTTWETPIVLCPVSSQRAFHDDGEIATARAARSRRSTCRSSRRSRPRRRGRHRRPRRPRVVPALPDRPVVRRAGPHEAGRGRRLPRARPHGRPAGRIQPRDRRAQPPRRHARLLVLPRGRPVRRRRRAPAPGDVQGPRRLEGDVASSRPTRRGTTSRGSAPRGRGSSSSRASSRARTPSSASRTASTASSSRTTAAAPRRASARRSTASSRSPGP